MKLVDLPNNPNAFYSHMVGNRGLTCVGIIETSHIALHSWDEESPSLIQLDVYSCSKLSIETVLEHFSVFEPVKVEYEYIDRGESIVVLDSGKL